MAVALGVAIAVIVVLVVLLRLQQIDTRAAHVKGARAAIAYANEKAEKERLRAALERSRS